MNKFFFDNNKNRIYGLDILRALAITFVVLSHSRFLLFPISDKFNYLRSWGFYGVELFFVLSGYLIGSIFIKKFLKDISWRKIKEFWIRRWFRTMPNYFLILLINLLILVILKKEIFFNYNYLIFCQNLFSPHPDFFDEAWSLTIEEWFYITLPLMFFISTLLLKNNSKYALLLSIISIFILSFTLRYITISQAPNINWDEGIRKIVLLRLDSILTGVLMAWIQFYIPNVWKRKKTLSAIGLTLLCIGIFLTEVHLYNPEHINFFSKLFTYNFIEIGIACLLPFFVTIKNNETFSCTFITHISIISYSIYVLHLSIIYKFIVHFIYPSTPLDSFFIITVYFIIVILASTINYRYFEKPMTDLRDRFKKTT